MDLNQEQFTTSTDTNMATKNKEPLSSAMKRTNEWISSQEIPSDVTVNAGGVSFSLHKFPLISKCGYLRKLVLESADSDLSIVEIPDVPGGAPAIELAAKFCYGINFEISIDNIAMLRCVAEYLEMTEDYAVGNLVSRTEAYVNEVTLKSLSGAVAVLHSSEDLLPIAEEVKLVSRCIDTIAFVACKDSEFCTPRRAEGGTNNLISSTAPNAKPLVDWWAEDLTVLRIDFFQRVLIAMTARGYKQYALGPLLMLYAQKSLRGLVRSHP
ncbi:BTB/POZ domain-containing protein [Forsythia ovata]|uniref:BTB/POZ domain-containing protein n=1 Tax=Forsythia ovata TaxID=205694 RepID=A0ABD1WPL8_9LAMI